MTTAPSMRPQVTFQARIASPAKRPSTRGLARAPISTPSKVPTPSTGTAAVAVGANIVMMPARKRSLSCQSVLVTWNGSREASPQSVRPSKAT